MKDEKFRWELWDGTYCFARYKYEKDAKLAQGLWAGACACDCMTFTIRDSLAPKFKWTKESVAAVDWKQKSTVETLEACAEHWQERIDAGCDTSSEEWWRAGYCPACRKWLSACRACPLVGGACCDGQWGKFTANRTKPNAQAVLDYIKKILEQEREKECKAKEWRPKLGEEVKIIGMLHSRQGRVIGIRGGYALLFNPSWQDGHDGWDSGVNAGINHVPGYPKSHMGFSLVDLRPISKECKK